MEPITQDVYIVVDFVKADTIITSLSEHKTGVIYAEKKSDMVVMTKEEWNNQRSKIAGDAFQAGSTCENLCSRGWQSEAVSKTEYINQLIK